MKLWTLLNMVLFIILLACSNQNEAPALADGEILFNVDSTLIQTPFTSAEFSFQISPPAGWEASTAEMLEEIKSSVVQPKGAFQVQPLQFYIHPEHHALLAVSQVVSPDTSMEPKSVKEEYITVVRTTFALYNLQENRYIKTGIPVVQYLMQKDGNIIFKLLLEDSGNHLIQLDYVVPQSVYEQEAKAIESSIGSISI